MRLSGTLLGLVFLEPFFSLTLVGQVTARKSSAGRRKNDAQTRPQKKEAPFDVEACIRGAGTMPTSRFVAPAAAGASLQPFFPSILGAADDVSQQQFLSNYWGRQACLVRSDDGKSQHRFSLTMADLQTIIRDNPNEMVAGAGFKFASNGTILGRSIEGQVVDVDTALDGYAQGATVVLNDIAALWPPLTAFKNKMEDELRIPISANLYLTPEGERGFDPHYDMDDTFILQLEGVKEWVVWNAGGWSGEEDATTTSPLRDQRAHMHDTPPDTVPRHHFVMHPGDVLYIPRGVTHVAVTTAETPSMHVTFAVHALCWEHFMRFLFAPGGPQDSTRAPFQLGHHAWAVAASDALAYVPPLPSTRSPFLSSLGAHFVNCKASRTGGRRDISIGMTLQWWLHDIALIEPSLRSTFSWYWTGEEIRGASGAATALGKETFEGLIALLRSHAKHLEDRRSLKRRMKTLGCSAPSDEKLFQIRTTVDDILAAAEDRTDECVVGTVWPLSSV